MYKVLWWLVSLLSRLPCFACHSLWLGVGVAWYVLLMSDSGWKKKKQPKTLKQATVLYISPLWNASEEYTFFLLLGHVRWSVIRFEQSCLTQSSQACWTGPWLYMTHTHTHTQTKPSKLFSTSETCCHPLYTQPTPLTQSSLPWCQSPRFRMDRTLSLWSVWSGSTCWLREASDADAWMASPQRDS